MNKENIELRSFNLNASEGRTIRGFIPYDSPSEPLPFIETISKGAFTKTLRESKNIRALYAHEDNSILASTKNGSLTFEDRDDGLYFSFELPNTRLGDDVQELVRTGLVDGCSFGMIVTKDEWSPMRDRRTIKELRLFEVSLCPQNQAYQGSTCICRSLSEMYEGQEITKDKEEEIKKEIDRLVKLIGDKADEINEQKQTEVASDKETESDSHTEEQKQEPSVEVSEPLSETDTQTDEPKNEENYSDEMLEKLLARLDSVESLLKQSEESLCQ